MIEYELKVPLHYGEYNDLLKYLAKNVKAITQINYYYDDDKLSMNKQGITCRIREKNGKFTATIKDHISHNSKYSIENEKDISNEKDDIFFKNMGLKFQGSLTTERTVIYSDQYMQAVVDKNTYLGITDYELEVEYIPGFEEHATFMLRRFGEILHSHNEQYEVMSFFERTNTAINKSRRFFERKMLVNDTGRESFRKATKKIYNRFIETH